MAGQTALRTFAGSLTALVAILLLPILLTTWFERSAKLGGESDSKMSWIANRRLIHIILLGTVAAWWALWDFQAQSALLPTLELHLRGVSPTLVNLFSFWLPPIGAIATANLICYRQDRTILGRRWTTGDILRLTCWRTVSPFASLLFVVAGFDAIYDRKLIGILWFLAAAFSAFLGSTLLRLTEGMKLRRVKSGELYKRAFVLARNMATRLEHVYVVPAGRGHLTNAYGLSQSIAVTDNYGRFLNGPQLDFVIGHELAHVKERHGRSKLMIVGAVYAGVALVCFNLPQMLLRFRPLLDVFVLLVPILISYYFSRRFEYAADAASVEYTHDPEAAIRALANLHRLTQVPTDCDRLSELFLTHPAFTRRARAIGELSRMPAERLSELIDHARLRAADSV